MLRSARGGEAVVCTCTHVYMYTRADYESTVCIVVRHLSGTLIKDEEHGTIIQLQGDIRKEVAEFLIDATALISKDQVMIHGS